MQLQGGTDLATSPHPCECDGAKLLVNNFQIREEKTKKKVTGESSKGISCLISLIVFYDESVLVHEKGTVNIVCLD